MSKVMPGTSPAVGTGPVLEEILRRIAEIDMSTLDKPSADLDEIREDEIVAEMSEASRRLFGVGAQLKREMYAIKASYDEAESGSEEAIKAESDFRRNRAFAGLFHDLLWANIDEEHNLRGQEDLGIRGDWKIVKLEPQKPDFLGCITIVEMS